MKFAIKNITPKDLHVYNLENKDGSMILVFGKRRLDDENGTYGYALDEASTQLGEDPRVIEELADRYEQTWSGIHIDENALIRKQTTAADVYGNTFPELNKRDQHRVYQMLRLMRFAGQNRFDSDEDDNSDMSTLLFECMRVYAGESDLKYNYDDDDDDGFMHFRFEGHTIDNFTGKSRPEISYTEPGNSMDIGRDIWELAAMLYELDWMVSRVKTHMDK